MSITRVDGDSDVSITRVDGDSDVSIAWIGGDSDAKRTTARIDSHGRTDSNTPVT